MSKYVRLYAQPAMLRCRTWTCDYCDDVCHHELRSAVGGMRGLLVCEEHKAWGKRDIRASWHRANRVWVEDLIAACPELTSVELDSSGFAYRQDDGRWFVPMKTFGLEGELEGSIREKLEAGLYKADAEGFQAALVLEKERQVALREAKAAAAAEKAALAIAIREKQRKEAVGRTRLGESKEEMLRRLTVVAGAKKGRYRKSEDDGPVEATSTAAAAATATAPALAFEEEGWTKVGH